MAKVVRLLACSLHTVLMVLAAAVLARFLSHAGELEMWNKAEAALQEALDSSGREWVLNPEDGAFYGPKIDITGEGSDRHGNLYTCSCVLKWFL
jgi:threonyl-tRNA synthetase